MFFVRFSPASLTESCRFLMALERSLHPVQVMYPTKLSLTVQFDDVIGGMRNRDPKGRLREVQG